MTQEHNDFLFWLEVEYFLPTWRLYTFSERYEAVFFTKEICSAECPLLDRILITTQMSTADPRSIITLTGEQRNQLIQLFRMNKETILQLAEQLESRDNHIEKIRIEAISLIQSLYDKLARKKNGKQKSNIDNTRKHSRA